VNILQYKELLRKVVLRHHFIRTTILMKKFIVVVGTSAGGSILLPALFKQFMDEMNLTVLVVMHLSKRSIGELLVNRLQESTSYTCKIPAQGEIVKTKHIYLSKPDHHLMIKGNKILLGSGPMENRYRPSIDALFRSAAASHGSNVIGIILTGLLEDGAAGMLAIRKAGGTCIIQDPPVKLNIPICRNPSLTFYNPTIHCRFLK
jgi:two-component system chemotaxis response regulator CheB